jgi:hypothetical protein
VSRHPGTDEAGRPIVAELGRAETAAETAERKAGARLLRRSNQTAFNLVVALIASLAVVAFVVLVVVRPQTIEAPLVDYRAVAADAQSQFAAPLAAPALPAGWSANRAGPRDEGGVLTWQIGFLTPSGEYIGLIQAVDADDDFVAGQTAEAAAGDRAEFGGAGWNVFDRRDVRDPGNLAYALVTTLGHSTIVLGGTAADDEFETLATAVAEQLGAGT